MTMSCTTGDCRTDRLLGGLDRRDRELFRLHYVHGLAAAGIATELGLSVPTVYVAMSRLRNRLRRCLVADLVATEGAASCPSAAALAAPLDGALTPLWRKRLSRHAEHCDSCRTLVRRATATDAIELLMA
jgi:pectate disaccharide-lyase